MVVNSKKNPATHIFLLLCNKVVGRLPTLKALSFKLSVMGLEVVNTKLLSEEIKQFEFKYFDEGNEIADIVIKFDEKSDGFVECKNYLGNQNQFLQTKSNFVPQFAAYLSQITDLSQLRYYFHTRYKGNLKDHILAAFESKKGLLNNDKVIDIVKSYATKKGHNISIDDIDDVLSYFANYDDWFKLIFR